MDIVNDLRKILDDPNASISREWVEEARAKYPYFILPSILYLQQHKQDGREKNEDMLSQLAITAPDRRALYDLLGDNAFKFSSFYPKEEELATPDTNSTLDSFLDQFGSKDEKEIEILNQLIFNPTPDYAQMLAAEEEKSKPSAEDLHNASEVNSQDALINKFIAQSKENKGVFPSKVVETPKPEAAPLPDEPVEAPVENDESMLTESLAKIYIKQRKYSKALEIIKSLSLKFPEKSIYFADQIRFLQKLIIAQNLKNNK